MNRLDRGLYTAPIWAGLFLSGIYVLVAPPMLHKVSGTVEDSMAAVMIVAAGACLAGLGIRPTHVAYRVELAGLVGIVGVLAWLTVESDYTLWQQFTLSGGMAGMVQIGSIRMALRLALELRNRQWESR